VRYSFSAIVESVSGQTMPIGLRCCRFDEFGMVEAKFGHELPFAWLAVRFTASASADAGCISTSPCPGAIQLGCNAVSNCTL
jgi:hypothetical protein